MSFAVRFSFPFHRLLSHLQQKRFVSLDFLLQLQHSEQEGFGCRWASWDVNIHRHNTIASSHNRVRVVIISTSIGTRSHGNNPTWFWHLIVDLSQGGCHFVGQSTGHNHDIRLTGRGPKDHTESLHIVPRGGSVHHFYGATSQTKGHGPERTLACPVDQIIDSANGVFNVVLHRNLIQPFGFQLFDAVQFSELQGCEKLMVICERIH